MLVFPKRGCVVMFKLNKLADYATVIMAYFATHSEHLFTAKDLANATHITFPTVSKLLKLLTKAKLLKSVRGVKGGYELARSANNISIAEILLAIDNQLAITDCSHAPGSGDCLLEPHCSISRNWQLISQTIIKALESLTLAEMAKPMIKKQIPAMNEIFINALNIRGLRSAHE